MILCNAPLSRLLSQQIAHFYNHIFPQMINVASTLEKLKFKYDEAIHSDVKKKSGRRRKFDMFAAKFTTLNVHGHITAREKRFFMGFCGIAHATLFRNQSNSLEQGMFLFEL